MNDPFGFMGAINKKKLTRKNVAIIEKIFKKNEAK